MRVNGSRLCLAGVACALLAFAPAFSSAQTPPAPGENADGKNLTRQTQQEISIALPSLAPLAEHVLPAVVNISVELNEQAALQGDADTSGSNSSPSDRGSTPFDQFLHRFFEQPFANRGEKIMALGSGFIIDPNGYIVTNNHVVANADKVTVILQDNSQHKAKVIGRDQRTDIALLKINTDEKCLT
jgi:serine protease Do